MSTKHVENKKIVMDFHNKIYGATVDTIENIINEYCHEDFNWNGPQPFNELEGTKTVVEKFWKSLVTAFPDVKKDVYLHYAGNDPMHEGQDWVASSGNYVGTFEEDWLDIPATNGVVWIRFAEFNQIVDGKIKQTYTLIDILDLMRQAGFKFIKALAPEVNIPGPATLDGVIMGEKDKEESKKSYEIMYDMIFGGLLTYEEEKGIADMGMGKYFSGDFNWYGPCGIGSTKGIKGFEKYHQIPFLNALPDRTLKHGQENQIYIGEGKYAALIEWSGFTATHTGNDWLGIPATGKHLVMRNFDFYRREGNYLVENWVFLDMIDILKQLGIDIFDRLRNKKYIL
ncbi:ester cyclase [Clostridium sp. DL1XJH146]